jgi:Domain of unknown function (DUF1975).
MLFFFDRYTENVAKLQETMRCLGQEVQIAVLQDDGFLPTGIESPYEFFVYRSRQKEFVEKSLFYNFIELPEFWEVRLTGWTGGIFDMGCEKAKIYFKEPAEERNVQRVEWHMENGWVYKIDYYNKYGLKYASEFLDTDRNVESKVFYSDKNQEIVVEQPVNHIISLLERGTVRKMFDSYAGVVGQYLKEAGLDDECILFVQDEKTFELLSLTSEEKNRWTHILFSNDELRNKYIGMGGQNGGRFYAIRENYSGNQARGKALILTASDQIEKLEYLIEELPDLEFYIAAHTQVSDKLYKLAELDNVEVYPQVSIQDLNMLWESCDFYLDINHYREIYNAVDTAQMRNMLIMGFANTVHHRELLAQECIFEENEEEKMALAIKALIGNPALMQEKLEIQQQKKEEIWKEFLQRRVSNHGI